MKTIRPAIDHPRRPVVGDVLEVGLGEVTVTWVGRYGREVIYDDAIGREWHDERAENGYWTRVERASDQSVSA